MSPSLPTARPAWVWSLPAFAIILSIFWFRRKRGSLKTDSGGAGETQDDQTNIDLETRLEICDNVGETEIALSKSENEKEEAIEVVNQVNISKTVEAVPRSILVPVLEADKNQSDQSEKKEEIVEEIVEELDTEKIKANEETVISAKKNDSTGKNKCSRKKKFKNMAKKSSDSLPDQRQKKEENAACILEEKLAKLDLANEEDVKQTSEDVVERDSANNSPSEVMLASPSVSGYSDTHSEGSSDSGKGCSEMLTPSRTPASGNSVSGDLPVSSMYEFVIPQQLVGRLIGRHGSYVNEIKETTHASIYIKRHPDTPKLKICAIEGTQMDIESALDMIRRKFPKKRYPNVTLEQVVIFPEPQINPIISENMQLYLIEGINNDVILSSLVSAGHFFLQQPTHPTYPSLSRLNSYMMYCYSEPDQPTIPEGVGAGILCAAPVHNGWYRAQITNMDTESNICDVKFVDYGGYMTMPVSSLRQIRMDFVNLPFQAAECYLAGVKPANEENVWSDDAKELVEKLTFGKFLQAQIYGYAEDSVPLIYLYTAIDDEVILINQELVNRGFAEWLYSEPVTEEIDEIAGSEIEDAAPVAVAV